MVVNLNLSTARLIWLTKVEHEGQKVLHLVEREKQGLKYPAVVTLAKKILQKKMLGTY
jgi:hypothetical protein